MRMNAPPRIARGQLSSTYHPLMRARTTYGSLVRPQNYGIAASNSNFNSLVRARTGEGEWRLKPGGSSHSGDPFAGLNMWTIARSIRPIENACSPFIPPLWRGSVFRFSRVFGMANRASVAETARWKKLPVVVDV